MPSYNHERFIGEAIESVLGQSFRDLELIIVDDASADNSRKVIESYRTRDARVRAFFHPANRGMARSLNDGLDEARGKFAAFLASDDIWAPDKLHRQLAVLENNENWVVFSDVQVIDAEGRDAGKLKTGERQRHGIIPGAQVLRRLLDRNSVADQAMILKRQNIEGVRYDEQLKYLSDYKFNLELARRYDFYFMPDCLAKYRLHGGNSIDRDAAGWVADFGAFGRYVLANYAGILSRQAKAKYLYRIGCDVQARGNRAEGRSWMWKALLADPLKTEYALGWLSSLAGKAVLPRSIRRRVGRRS
jgi:glycosyltransferase involved in cell wall biosynthesis